MASLVVIIQGEIGPHQLEHFRERRFARLPGARDHTDGQHTERRLKIPLKPPGLDVVHVVN